MIGQNCSAVCTKREASSVFCQSLGINSMFEQSKNVGVFELLLLACS